MDSDNEEKEPIIKERLILDNVSDSQRGVFSEVFKKTRKNRSRLLKEDPQTNINRDVDLSAFGTHFLPDRAVNTVYFINNLINLLINFAVTVVMPINYLRAL